MENHPIPQDVTGFQFKLIGNMTVKQFAYLASGAVLAWVSLILPVFFFIKFPIALFCAGVGTSLAFLPIEGRPLDTMVAHFFRALISPTQYLYHHNAGRLWFSDIVKNQKSPPSGETNQSLSGKRLQDYLKNLPTKPQGALDDKELAFFKSLTALHQTSSSASIANSAIMQAQTLQNYIQIHTKPQDFQSMHISQQNTTQSKTSSDIGDTQSSTGDLSFQKNKTLSDKDHISEEEKEHEKEMLTKDEEQEKTLIKEEEDLEHNLQAIKQRETLETQDAEKQKDRQITKTIQTQLDIILSQKEKLEKEIESLRGKLQLPASDKTTAADTSILSQPSGLQPTQTPANNVVRLEKPGPQTRLPAPPNPITVARQQSGGLIMPDFPNLVTGSIKDPRGNPLASILVEIKDQDGNPVRAFKTNGLGQFASATPLVNGDYTIDCEDQKKENKFETTHFSATGAVITPLEIISMDTREELRRSLFNS